MPSRTYLRYGVSVAATLTIGAALWWARTGPQRPEPQDHLELLLGALERSMADAGTDYGPGTVIWTSALVGYDYAETNLWGGVEYVDVSGMPFAADDGRYYSIGRFSGQDYYTNALEAYLLDYGPSGLDFGGTDNVQTWNILSVSGTLYGVRHPWGATDGQWRGAALLAPQPAITLGPPRAGEARYMPGISVDTATNAVDQRISQRWRLVANAWLFPLFTFGAESAAWLDLEERTDDSPAYSITGAAIVPPLAIRLSAHDLTNRSGTAVYMPPGAGAVKIGRSYPPRLWSTNDLTQGENLLAEFRDRWGYTAEIDTRRTDAAPSDAERIISAGPFPTSFPVRVGAWARVVFAGDVAVCEAMSGFSAAQTSHWQRLWHANRAAAGSAHVTSDWLRVEWYTDSPYAYVQAFPDIWIAAYGFQHATNRWWKE